MPGANSNGEPTVSVIIPARNAAPYIQTAIDSALAQSHSVLEILVIDGGSTDGTQEIVTAYGAPVKLLHEQPGRKGLGAARNVGIEAATGDWLAFLDADDWWETRKIADQLAALSKVPGATLNYTGICEVDDVSGKRSANPCMDAALSWPALRWINVVATSSVLAKRTAVIEVGAFDEQLAACEDWELWVRLRARHPFTSCEEPLTFYRILPNSSSQNLRKHLETIPRLCDGAMLAGLTGLERWSAEKRIWAAQLYGGALIDRTVGGGQVLRLLFRSIGNWPLPTFLPIRYKVLLHQLLRGRRQRGSS
jgi:glycosyltransferase involved in cell wall biosynthesis